LRRYRLSFPIKRLVILLALVCSSIEAVADSATWKASPVSGDWNAPANWMPRTVPNDISDIATFNTSTITEITFSSGAIVGGIIFNAGASPFSINVYGPGIPNLMLYGSGVTNNSGITQQIVVSKDAASMGNGVYFNGSALAGVNTAYTNSGNLMNFLDSSSADHATIISDGNANGFGVVEFFGTSTAGQATIINNGAEPDSPDNATALIFLENSTAGDAVITANGGLGVDSMGGQMQFDSLSTAANAVLIANGGVNGGLGGRIFFLSDGGGGASRVELFGNGTLDMSNEFLKQVTIGSLEGDGLAFLGGGTLTIGGNNLTTTFTGTIQDGGGFGGSGASLTKTGTGTLNLASANTYTGGTTVSAGTLLVGNSDGSATGTGAVKVNSGSLGGGGSIGGAVTIGTGGGGRAFLVPATSRMQATLTIQNALTLQSGATYTCTFAAKRHQARSDLVIANGVTIDGQVTINLHGSVQGTLAQGLTFTLLSDTAATPISGRFANLSDGAVVTLGGTNFQASYEGGDGNDLTLTVVP
jgi:autotransporter-associated beta strand protein